MINDLYVYVVEGVIDYCRSNIVACFADEADARAFAEAAALVPRIEEIDGVTYWGGDRYEVHKLKVTEVGNKPIRNDAYEGYKGLECHD